MSQEPIKCLIFKAGHEEYGIPIDKISSIERTQGLTISAYPNREPHVLGFSTIRNRIIPVVDMCSTFNLDTENSIEATRLIIVKVQEKEIGLSVEKASEFLDVSPESIQHPRVMGTENAQYIQGVTKFEQRLIILLDIERLLENTVNLEELKAMIAALTEEQESIETE
ncbi:chemotaxis protein CheW [Pullulanibacillus sp. KACC 23026]|uniref:chemotaxis protein CheW n=1 Tax=Pullulanibacillus sp. KACC 23026 TaxID=3028315 RepID=UPI0023B1DAB8|nr:chemotaxis protein CheW [Pullulanibacillus sp. KACC 23026]WEG14972.1 chemotaxis protein CheW [Pullulanibacillus sp. KACC 23026]